MNRTFRRWWRTMHTGNMGKKQDLQNLVRAAQLSRQDSGRFWLLVGEGEERAALSKRFCATTSPTSASCLFRLPKPFPKCMLLPMRSF